LSVTQLLFDHSPSGSF